MKKPIVHRARLIGQTFVTTRCGLCFLRGSRHKYTRRYFHVTCRSCLDSPAAACQEAQRP